MKASDTHIQSYNVPVPLHWTKPLPLLPTLRVKTEAILDAIPTLTVSSPSHPTPETFPFASAMSLWRNDLPCHWSNDRRSQVGDIFLISSFLSPCYHFIVIVLCTQYHRMNQTMKEQWVRMRTTISISLSLLNKFPLYLVTHWMALLSIILIFL